MLILWKYILLLYNLKKNENGVLRISFICHIFCGRGSNTFHMLNNITTKDQVLLKLRMNHTKVNILIDCSFWLNICILPRIVLAIPRNIFVIRHQLTFLLHFSSFETPPQFHFQSFSSLSSCFSSCLSSCFHA